MLEMAKYLKPDEAEAYRATAKRLMKALYDGYAVKDPQRVETGWCYTAPILTTLRIIPATITGVDQCNVWG